MTKIKLRGLKLLEEGAQVVSSYPGNENPLAADVCSPLALNKINLTFLTHVSPDKSAACITSICTEGSAGRASASLIEAHRGGGGQVDLQAEVSTLSVYPHEQRPEVIAELLQALARKRIPLQGLASSPSALSSVVLSKDTEAAIDALFDVFEFPAYNSPSDWHAAYEGKEHLLRKIIASYQEKVIKIYDLVEQTELDLWSLALPASGLSDLGAALEAMGQTGLKFGFVAAVPDPRDRLLFSFCFPQAQQVEIRRSLTRHLSSADLTHHPQVAALYIHGPHFGDRYGIADTLVRALEDGGISLLALACTVSSISGIVREKDLTAAVQALDASFQRSST